MLCSNIYKIEKINNKKKIINMSYVFSSWSGENGIQDFIIKKTGCKPYSGAGINPRIKKNNYLKVC